MGAENFNAQAFYNAAMKFKTEGPIWEGYPEWNFTEARKYLPTDLFVYEYSAEAEDLVRVSDWLPVVTE